MMPAMNSAQRLLTMRRQARDIFLADPGASEDQCTIFGPKHNDVVHADSEIAASLRSARRYFDVVNLIEQEYSESGRALACRMLLSARTLACRYGPFALLVRRSLRGESAHEFPVLFSLLAEQYPISRPWVILSANTQAPCPEYQSIGAVLDAGSCVWIRQTGQDPGEVRQSAHLRSALASSGDLLILAGTPKTRSDLTILLVH